MSRIGVVLALAALGSLAPGSVLAQASQRSTQGDCTREVERRGYDVVSTSNFRQFRDGWQLDVKARDQRGRLVDGSCFVETLSGDVDLYGFGWGGNTPIDDFELSCASIDGKYRECQLPVDGIARLVKRRSDAPCVEGSSWGQRGDRVWVDNGCRARFEVVRDSGSGGTGQTIDCRSENGRYKECTIGRKYTARLERDYTGRCRQDSTWGNREGVVWVTSGCQGRFRLVSSSGQDNPGQQQRAEVQCRNEAKRQYVNVRKVAPATLRGSYWETTVDGTLRGQNVRGTCRFYPKANRTELSFRDGGGPGGTGTAAAAVRACVNEAQGKDLWVLRNDPAQAVSGGYTVRMQVRLGNKPAFYATCHYRNGDGRADVDF
ncbi:MAG: DUF3011 domain-containing protein [Steroidobacteraceae bacterium]